MPETRAGRTGTARLFIGLWPDDAVRDALVEHQRRWTWPPHAAPTHPARLHATLHFLGDVDRAAVPGLRAALQQVPVAAFDTTLDVDERWHGGIAVVRPATPPPAWLALHAALADVLHTLRLRVERRPYAPHVTLARRAGGAVPPADPPAIRWTVRGHALVESRPGGAYATLQRYG